MAATVDQRLLAVPNLSEGTERALIDHLQEAVDAAAVTLLDQHSDPVHNRTVFTLAGGEEGLAEALNDLAERAIERIEIGEQRGAHPRIGALDVCPIVYPDPEQRERARQLARKVGRRLGSIGLPVFLYGELSRSPERRERAYFRDGGPLELARRMREEGMRPDFGPPRAHPTAGGVLLTARPPLAAFNLEAARGATIEQGRAIAARLRESGGGLPGVRALGIELAPGRIQVSTNVHDPVAVPLAEVVRAAEGFARREGTSLLGAELVGLVPAAALVGYPADLPVAGGALERRTIEARLAADRAGT